MIDQQKEAGPIERKFAQSNDPKLQRLCQMDNGELMDYMDELIEMGGDMDDAMYDAAQQLLDERAPIATPGPEALIQSWESFKSKHPEVFQSEDPKRTEPAKRTYTLRRSLLVAAMIAVLVVAFTAGAWAATNIDFQDLGEVVMRNIKYGESGQLECVNPLETGYTSLAEAIKQTSGSDTIECATWIPSDFSLTRVTASFDEGGSYHYSAYYEAPDRSLAVLISEAYEMPIAMEKDADTEVEKMRWHGNDYLIVSNSDFVNCEWDKAGYSYSVVGNVTVDELKSVVKSFK